MAEGRKRLAAALTGFSDKKQDKPVLFPAILGAYVDGVPQIKVASRPDFVWVRLRGSTSEVVQALNESVGEHWDLPILVFRDPRNPAFWKIYGRDIGQYASWGGASYLPPHGDAHSFSATDKTGIDPVWVFKRQYMPLLPHPVISGANGIYVEPDFYYWGGRYNWWPGSGTTSLLGSRPTGALNGAFVTVYLDGASRTLQSIKGPEFPAWYPPTDASAFITLPSPLQGIPIAAVFLTTGSTRIGWGEIYDLRMPAEALSDQIYTGSLVLRNEGVVLGSITTLDFVGALVDATISGTYGRVLISGSTGGGAAGGSGSVQVYDEGAPQGSATILNFVGAGVQATVSGTYATVTVAQTITAVIGPGTGSAYYLEVGLASQDSGDYYKVPDPPYVTGSLVVFINGLAQRPGIDYIETYAVSGTYQYLASPPTGASHLALWAKLVPGGAIASGTVQVWDESAPLGSANILNFVGAGVTATISGTVIAVTIPGGGGGGGVDQIGVYGLDEGVPLGTGSWLNFVGAGVTATRSGTMLTISIPGGAGSAPVTGTVVGLDEGQILGSFDRLNFRGPGVVATASGSYLDVVVPGPGVDQIGIVGWQTGTFVGTGTVLDIEGAILSISGTVLRLLITGAVGPQGPAGAAGATGSTGPQGPAGQSLMGVFGLDDGLPVGTGSWLNFVGAGVTASRSGTVIDVNIPGGGTTNPPITGSVVGSDEGLVLGSALKLDFVGPGVTASLSGTVLQINIPGGGTTPPPITGSVVVSDESIVQGSAVELDFVGAGVTAAVAAGKATITVSASGGGATPRAGVCLLVDGNYWRVPDFPYITGSLMVFANGVAQRPVTDYTEDIPASGVFQFTSAPATGSVVVATWGKA